MAYPGTRKRVTFTVYDETVTPHILADPTAITVTYGRTGAGSPTPTVKNYPADTVIVRDSVGVFHIDIDCPTAGNYAIEITATAGVLGAAALSWQVNAALIG